MWTVIYMAQDRYIVDNVNSLLAENNIITKVRTLKNEQDCCFEILVPASEVCTAHGVILEAEL